MATFTDNAGREWRITLDGQTMEDVAELADVDLWAVLDDPFNRIAALLGNRRQLLKVLAALLGPQLEQRKLTMEDFRRAFNPPTMNAAGESLVEALADFSKAPALQQAIARVREAARKIEEAGRRAAESGEINQAIDRALVGPSFGSPESSGSPPAN